MSVRWMAAVWEHSKAEGTVLLIQLAMADFANDEGYLFPAVGTIARKARCTDRYARTVVAAMEVDSMIEIERSPGKLNLYRFRPPEAWLRDPGTAVQPSLPDPGTPDPQTPEPQISQTVIEPFLATDPSGDLDAQVIALPVDTRIPEPTRQLGLAQVRQMKARIENRQRKDHNK